MKTTLTITSKGQTTIPVALRRQLGVVNGGALVIDFDPTSQHATLSKPLPAQNLSAHFSRYVKPGSQTVADASSYYQSQRTVRK